MRLAAFLPRTSLLALAVLAAAGAVAAQDAVVDFVEVRHPVRGRVIGLVAPEAARHHGAPLPGFKASGLHPSAPNPRAQPQRPVAGWMPDATVRAAARRFGLGEPERELAFQRAESDGLGMVHEGWEQQWQGVPVYGAALIVHRNARGEVTSIGGRVLPTAPPGEVDGALRAPSQNNAEGPSKSAALAREPLAWRSERAIHPGSAASSPNYSADAAVAAAKVAAEAAPEFVRARRMALAAARREVGDSPAGVAARMQAFAAEAGFQLSGTPRLYWYDEAFLADRSETAQSSPRASARKTLAAEGTRALDSASDELKLGITLREAGTLLVWKLTLRSGEEWEETYFVDAATGKVVKRQLEIAEAVNRQIYDCTLAYPTSPGCRIDHPKTYGTTGLYWLGRSEGQPTRGPTPSDWGPPYTGSQDVDNAYTTFVPAIHQYLADRFGRNGANDRGGTGDGTGSRPFDQTFFFANANGSTTGMTLCNPGYAFAQTTSVAFCVGSLAADAYDVLGHEYGHLISRYRSFNGNTPNSLLNVGFSGALNENASDVYGETFEYYMTGSNNWIFGGGANHIVYRSLIDPPTIISPVTGGPNPDRFHSSDVYCGTSDNGGVHHNSTVPGKAAYLTAAGGDFNGCSITGIGTQKVEQIWYRASVSYYVPSETFNGAYVALRQACLDLYPAADCAELTKALQAVELDQPGKCSGLPAQPPACAPRPVLHSEQTPLGPRWFWGSEAAGWTLQVNYDLANPAGWTDVQVITAPGEYLPQASAPAMFCRLNYKR